MLLAVDVGNTNTMVGVFRDEEVVAHWRLRTEAGTTADEFRFRFAELFRLDGLDRSEVQGAVVGCVVPPLQDALVEALVELFDVNPLIVGPGIRTGMPILLDNPKEVGADRIANAVAAYEEAKKACIVVDFGTATTFDFVSAAGEYLGGAIAPGLAVSAEALYASAARLTRVTLVRPRHVVGRNTEESIQSGIVFGYAALVDGLVERMLKEKEVEDFRIFATGGYARFVVGTSRYVRDVDEFLTIRGLRLLYEKNRS